MSNVNKIRIGILGCSSIAERQVIPAILQSNRFELISVASRNTDKAKRFSSMFYCDNCNYDELIKNNKIDAIYISLPNSLHYHWGMKVISAGKHLLMEKPFTHSLKTTKKIILAANKKNLIAFEGLVYFFHPLFHLVQENINNGNIGQLRHIEANFGFPFPEKNNIRYNMSLGGGSLLDSFIYPLSFCLSIIKKQPNKVAYILKYDHNLNIDTGGIFLLNFNDITATINYGFDLMYRNNYFIWGNMGYLQADRVFTRPNDFTNNIIITQQNKEIKISVPIENQVIKMLLFFADRIQGKCESKFNENLDIVERIKIISKYSEIIHKKLKINIK